MSSLIISRPESTGSLGTYADLQGVDDDFTKRLRIVVITALQVKLYGFAKVGLRLVNRLSLAYNAQFQAARNIPVFLAANYSGKTP